MGCNTSQELKAKKPEDDSAGVGEKNQTEQQTTTAVNGDALADGDNSSPSVEDNSAIKTVVPSSTSGAGTKNTASESEQNAKNNGIQHSKQQQRSLAGDVINDGKHHNGLMNGDIKDDSCSNVKRCERAEITELNNVDIDEDDEEDEEEEEEDEEDEAKAATKIQAAFRGHKVRATMKKSDDKSAAVAATTNKNPPAATDGKSKAAAVAVAAAAAENVDPTKEELEAEFDPNDKELCDAALKIQATFRGHLSRKLVGNKDAEDVDIQEITKKVAEELDIDLTDPELNKAATKIQASFRGHKSRKDLPAN